MALLKIPSAIVSPTREVVLDARNRSVARQAASLLNELEQVLLDTAGNGLPALHAVELDDGSLLLEWVLPDRRTAITVDASPEHSGWYILAKDASGEHQTWGYLDALDIAALIKHMQ
jgi:hypothetical protein